MLSVRAIIDAGKLKFLEPVIFDKPKNVIITFLEDGEVEQPNHINAIMQHGKAFDFLDNDAEDIYTDKDLKVKYH